MTKKQEAILDLLLHFHPESDSRGSWDIYANTNMVSAAKKEFKGVLKVVKKQGKSMISKASGKFKPEHEVILFRYMAESYKKEADKYYYGIKKLVG